MSIHEWFSPRGGNGDRKLAVIGGRLEDGNALIYGEMHRLSGGRILVFPTASAEPEAVGPETVQVFQSYGFDAALSPVHGPNAVAAAQDPANAAEVARYGSVYFTGGNQVHIVEALAPGGVETPVLAAIREAHARGGLIAGSSAGAAMMSRAMIVGGTSLDATVHGVTEDPEQPGMLLGEGLGFFPYGIVDQHFIKRGRLGRLVVAMAKTGVERGFGIDENTALFVSGQRGRIIGEYGVFALDMRNATLDPRGRTFENIGFSYLDHGDEIDLVRMRGAPGPGKRRVRQGEIAYRAPARSRRNVFGAYTLYDVLARLVLGDPAFYLTDRASAVDLKAATAVTVELERVRGQSRALIAVEDNAVRITALNFRATVMTERLTPSRLARRAERVQRAYGAKPSAAARLILLGSSPLQAGPELNAEMLQRCEGPVGIIAAASAEPERTAATHVDLLRREGVEAFDLGITINNVARLGRNEALVEEIAALKTILFTGGNQIRLVETLLHRGEETPILLAIAKARAKGAAIIAASGSASALSDFMVAGGTSFDALRYGVSSDQGHNGLVIQEGIGFFGAGIVDQNVFSSRRLGRLIVACAEEGAPHGFGICEETLMDVSGDGSRVDVAGRNGVVLVEVDASNLVLQSDSFVARGVKLTFVRPGDSIELPTGIVRRNTPVEPATAALDRLVRELASDCSALPLSPRPIDPHRYRAIEMGVVEQGAGIVKIDIASPRDDRD